MTTMGKRRPAITVRYVKSQGDFVYDWPPMRGGKNSVHFIHGILNEPPHVRPNPPLDPLPVAGGLLCPEVLEELERRGFDTKGIRVIIPVSSD